MPALFREPLTGVSKEEDRSEVDGEVASPGRLAVLLLPARLALRLWPDGVRAALTLRPEFGFDAGSGESAGLSDDVTLLKDKAFDGSDEVESAFERPLSLLVFGVRGGAVLCRGIRSCVRESLPTPSLSASELRALEAALMEIGEGREGEGALSACRKSGSSTLALLSEGFTGLRVRGVVSLLELPSHVLYRDSELCLGFSDDVRVFKGGRDSSWPSVGPCSPVSRCVPNKPHANAAALVAPGPSAGLWLCRRKDVLVSFSPSRLERSVVRNVCLSGLDGRDTFRSGERWIGVDPGAFLDGEGVGISPLLRLLS